MDYSPSVKTPLVSISCITYNQREYIAQALDGFLSQKTKFPFEVLVHDDCSTDGTDRIIAEYAKRYPDIIKPMYETQNQFSLGKGGSIEWNLPRACGKYFALCEGDDYWIDPYKLQKQVDYLEMHPEVGLCYTNFNILYQATGIVEKDLFATNPRQYPAEYTTPEAWVLRNGYTAPPSWVMRTDLMPRTMMPTNDSTFVLFTHFLVNSKVAYLPFTSVVYRILDESAAHSKDYFKQYRRNKILLDVKFRLIEQYRLAPDLKEMCIQKYFHQGLLQFVLHNQKDEINQARKILTDKTLKDKLALLIDSLSLNTVAAKMYSILRR